MIFRNSTVNNTKYGPGSSSHQCTLLSLEPVKFKIYFNASEVVQAVTQHPLRYGPRNSTIPRRQETLASRSQMCAWNRLADGRNIKIDCWYQKAVSAEGQNQYVCGTRRSSRGRCLSNQEQLQRGLHHLLFLFL